MLVSLSPAFPQPTGDCSLLVSLVAPQWRSDQRAVGAEWPRSLLGDRDASVVEALQEDLLEVEHRGVAGQDDLPTSLRSTIKGDIGGLLERVDARRDLRRTENNIIPYSHSPK